MAEAAGVDGVETVEGVNGGRGLARIEIQGGGEALDGLAAEVCEKARGEQTGATERAVGYEELESEAERAGKWRWRLRGLGHGVWEGHRVWEEHGTGRAQGGGDKVGRTG